MINDDMMPRPPGRNVEHSGESSADGGGYRFVFYGDQPGGTKKKKGKRSVQPEPPVKLDISKETLADEILNVHSEESMSEKVNELDEKGKIIEGDNTKKEDS